MIGGFELADLELVGARESPALVAEQLALEEIAGDGGAVHLHERPVATGAEAVDGPRRELLPGAGLARDQDGDVDEGGLRDDLAEFLHPGADPEREFLVHPGGRVVVLGRSSGRQARRSRLLPDGCQAVDDPERVQVLRCALRDGLGFVW